MQVEVGVMEYTPDPQQVRAVADFFMFLGDAMVRKSEHFELEARCTPEELRVLRVLMWRSPLMVKEIAQAVPTMSLSKMTRVLDRLEALGYITRTLNREDRRSFVVALTEPGTLMVKRLMQKFDEFVRDLLVTLSPAERLMLTELFGRIQSNWHDAVEQESKPVARRSS
jgi:DNA-binding MarR family transcriptional regulator